MAKSQTFGKRENEKKKQAKRFEKQKRREERQAGGSSSLDDMIAYVDENGNITDTPPQLRPKVEIQLEDIVIATPKKEDIAAEPLKGRVEYFNTEKGYGFIKDLASTEKYFFHISSAPEGIGEGRIVLFELMRGTRGIKSHLRNKHLSTVKIEKNEHLRIEFELPHPGREFADFIRGVRRSIFRQHHHRPRNRPLARLRFRRNAGRVGRTERD